MFFTIKNSILQHRVVSLIVAFVLVVIFSMVFFSVNQNVASQVPSEQTTAVKTHMINTSNPTVPPMATKIYSGNAYQIAFPQQWIQDTDTAAVYQDNMLSLQPDASNPNENAHVAVEITSTQDTSLAKMSAGLSLLGFKRTNTTVGGIAAQKFAGTVSLSQKVLHNIAYLFEYKNQVYLIKLSYQGTTDDPRLELEFTQSINSFRVN